MPSLFRAVLPVERPAAPLHGFKLAYPMLSADGRTAGFGGIWSSNQTVYRVEDTAVCFWNRAHSPPKRRCTCGFYCLHTFEEARAMACEARYRSTVILGVQVAGRFVRYEHGFRYSSQRVLSVRLNRCDCGRAATAVVDSGDGVPGWLRLQPRCLRCSVPREPITLRRYRSMLGGRVPVDTDGGLEEMRSWTGLPETPADPENPRRAEADSNRGTEQVDPASNISVLAAEVALLQARVDSLQAQLSRLTG